MSKIPSEIIRIDLTDASYKGTNSCAEQLTYVNFFFGNNGTGKSTIAKAIQSGTGVTYAPGRAFEDYIPLVYNQAFIDGNFSSYRNMPGVFTLNAKNAAAQKQIDEKTQARGDERKAKNAATEQRDKKAAAKEKLQKDFYKECWDREEAFRTEFEKRRTVRGNQSHSRKKSCDTHRKIRILRNCVDYMIPHTPTPRNATLAFPLPQIRRCWIHWMETTFCPQ